MEFNPQVTDFLAARDLQVASGHPKSWREFTLPGSPKPDFVITLAQDAIDAQWPGRPVVAHWTLNEMIDAAGTPRVAEQAIRDTFWELMRRIKIFASLKLEKTTRRTLQQQVEAIHAWQ